ncbi:MAG: DNA topoisomerase IV subunit B [Verrucomicrobiota bacterium]|jgi:DNA gyrase subunit B|nr:DNA topoisomerase IV subunit B [Verrucomicrobiota bacterium]MDI9383118.1 DNA topoisomerase IV subunit B [Verrucomicrobiota bacterium]
MMSNNEEIRNRQSKTYTAQDISVLKGLEPVRRRPAMYIGGTDNQGLHHLVWEILDNAVDEAINGFATTIEVVLDEDCNGIEITDDGRGIPVDLHKDSGRPALETILTTLHAGGKFNPGSYSHAGGLHGVGASVVNALSLELIAKVRRDGAEFRQSFRQGVPEGPMTQLRNSQQTGTSIFFRPDPEIFGACRFAPQEIREVLKARAYLHRGLKIVFHDKANRRSETFLFKDGIQEFLAHLVQDRGKKPTQDFVFFLERAEDPRIEIALQWTDDTGEFIRCYANGVYTPNGGTHEQGLKTGVVRAVRNFIDTHELQPKGLTLAAEDIREGLCAILSIYLTNPQFQGQTKDRLNNPEVTAQVAGVVGSALEAYFQSNGSIARAIVARTILAARARAASREAVAQVKRKSVVSHRLNLPGKLADCESAQAADCELFIVEGDSAGGSAKQARNRKFQAILPLRGKVLNTEQANLSKILNNKEISDILSAIGCGMGKNFDVSALRYHKIIVLTDADSDGHHIATLMLTFFFRYLPDLVRGGFVYLGMPPLYRIEAGKNQTLWAWDDEEKSEILRRLEGKVKLDGVTRFKGLGEMSPEQLKATTMDPASRTLLRVCIMDELEADLAVNELMGRDPSARYRFVMERAQEANDIDL